MSNESASIQITKSQLKDARKTMKKMTDDDRTIFAMAVTGCTSASRLMNPNVDFEQQIQRCTLASLDVINQLKKNSFGL